MIDPIDAELSRLCGEYYMPDLDMTQDGDGLGVFRGFLNALLFTLAFGAMFALGAWLAWSWQ